MALLIALVVLVVVSILGTTAMRSALFQSKVSVNQQASQLLFQGAESGLESVADFSANQVAGGTSTAMPAHIFNRVRNAFETIRICFDIDGNMADFNDVDREVLTPDDLAFDFDACPQRGDNPLEVTAIVSLPPPAQNFAIVAEGYSLGGTGKPVWLPVYSEAFARVAGLGYQKSHVQYFGVLAPSEGD